MGSCVLACGDFVFLNEIPRSVPDCQCSVSNLMIRIFIRMLYIPK